MKNLAYFDASLAALLYYGAYNTSGIIRYSQLTAAVYLTLGAYYNYQGKIQITG